MLQAQNGQRRKSLPELQNPRQDDNRNLALRLTMNAVEDREA